MVESGVFFQAGELGGTIWYVGVLGDGCELVRYSGSHKESEAYIICASVRLERSTPERNRTAEN